MAAAYDQTIAKVSSQVVEALLDAVGTEPGTRLLDVAYSPGWLVPLRADDRLGGRLA